MSGALSFFGASAPPGWRNYQLPGKNENANDWVKSHKDFLFFHETS
jgi:hypothetical protein